MGRDLASVSEYRRSTRFNQRAFGVAGGGAVAWPLCAESGGGWITHGDSSGAGSWMDGTLKSETRNPKSETNSNDQIPNDQNSLPSQRDDLCQVQWRSPGYRCHTTPAVAHHGIHQTGPLPRPQSTRGMIRTTFVIHLLALCARPATRTPKSEARNPKSEIRNKFKCSNDKMTETGDCARGRV